MPFPSDPRPAILREFTFAAGPSSGLAEERKVLIWGNKTASGSETLDVISPDPVSTDADAKARFGARSEWYAMYRKYVAVDPTATIFGLAPTESAGSAADVDYTVSTAGDSINGWRIEINGETMQYAPAEGDSTQVTAEGIRDLALSHDEGRLQVIASSADPTGGDWTLTFTAAQLGPRGDDLIGSGASRGVRITALGANAQTITKGSLTAGATDDDWTAAIVEASGSEFYYHAIANTATATVTASDNGVGELIDMIRQQSQPANGKDQVVFVGSVGTPAEANSVAISSAFNSVFGKLVNQEKSDWTSAQLAAHHCAIIRVGEVAYPAYNANNYTATDNTIYQVPKQFLKADIPAYSEIVSMLNNGVSPIVLTKDRVVWERHITTRSLNALASNDYRAREGHIPSVAHFFWDIANQRYQSIRQPNADSDPVGDRAPPALTTTPTSIRAMLEQLVEDLASDKPLDRYPGPILRPSAVDEMKASITVSYDGAGGFPSRIGIESVPHNLRWLSSIDEVSEAT